MLLSRMASGRGIPAWAALIASLAIHIGAAYLCFGGDRRDVPSPELERQVPDPIRPGIESSRTMTISWIGFERSTPHSAAAAEVEQAQVSPDAGAVAQQAAADAAEAIAHAGGSVTQFADRLAALASGVAQGADVARSRHEAKQAAERAKQASEARRSQPKADTPTLPDDRQADATSTEPHLVYAPGKPLARAGLRIRTVRPIFDVTTRIVELPHARRRPVVSVTFLRDGSVLKASFLPGRSTGIDSIDEPILTAVFRWIASGSDLDAIPSEPQNAGLTLTIRFDL